MIMLLWRLYAFSVWQWVVENSEREGKRKGERERGEGCAALQVDNPCPDSVFCHLRLLFVIEIERRIDIEREMTPAICRQNSCDILIFQMSAFCH